MLVHFQRSIMIKVQFMSLQTITMRPDELGSPLSKNVSRFTMEYEVVGLESHN